jgi:PAT family beta-lactamase induction signal transducer AmpG
MPQNKTLRYLIFGSLYFTQGTILGYFASLNALYLQSRGLTLTDIGIFGAIALIPFVIKIFLGMLSDKVNLFGKGHRIPYIYIGLAVQFLLLIFVPFVNPKQYYWGFVAMAFFLQLGMALYDTCTDGLALDTAPEKEHGRIQAWMVGGRAVGTVVAASAVGILADKVSWQAVFWSLAALTLLPALFLIGVKEPEKDTEARFDWSAFKAFKRWQVNAVGIAGLLVFLVIVGANQLVNPFLVETFKISLTQAGMITSLWGIGIVIGSFIGSGLIKKVGDRIATYIMLAMVAISLVLVATLTSTQLGLNLAVALVVLYGVAYGTAQTITFALCMGVTDTRIAASMFAILMAFTNVGQGIGLAMGGKLSDLAGFQWTFIAFAAVCILVLPFLPAVFGKRNQRTQNNAH